MKSASLLKSNGGERVGLEITQDRIAGISFYRFRQLGFHDDGTPWETSDLFMFDTLSAAESFLADRVRWYIECDGYSLIEST